RRGNIFEWNRAAIRRALVAERQLPRAIALPAQIDAEVEDDAVEPCVKARLAAKRRQLPKHFEEGFLGNVGGVIGVSDDAQGDRPHPLFVRLYEHSKRR